MPQRFTPLDFNHIKTYPLSDRPSRVRPEDFARPVAPGSSLRTFYDSLSDILIGRDFKRVVEAIANAHRRSAVVLWSMGAHVIKVGLSPLVIDLMESGIISAIALNGAGAIHDTEIVLGGETSENVADGIKAGNFGMVTETGEFINRATATAYERRIGLGRALGEQLEATDSPRKHLSILAAGARLDIPVTVHVAIGGDIHHSHPSTRGDAMGAATFEDFRMLCGVMCAVGEDAVVLNIGSAVVLPVILEKAFAAARNQGHAVEKFTGVNMDFIMHYRANNNPVSRARELGGAGYSLTGHHEIMIPLLAACVKDALAS
jgi:deoxyhypusine synthase